MKNKLAIQEKLMSIGFSLGIYDSEMDKLSKKELKKVLENMEYGDTDIVVMLDKKEYIVEVFYVENEVDFKVTSPKDYAKTYGRIFNQD